MLRVGTVRAALRGWLAEDLLQTVLAHYAATAVQAAWRGQRVRRRLPPVRLDVLRRFAALLEGLVPGSYGRLRRFQRVRAEWRCEPGSWLVMERLPRAEAVRTLRVILEESEGAGWWGPALGFWPASSAGPAV